MHNAIVVGGRLVGPRNVQLDEPVTDLNAGALVEVIVHTVRTQAASEQALTEFIGGLPVGTRCRKDIDEQLRSERAGWEKAQ